MLTLHKATKVVEGKMYIFCLISRWKQLLLKSVLVGQLSRTLRKYLNGSIFQNTFLCCIFFTKREAKVNTNVRPKIFGDLSVTFFFLLKKICNMKTFLQY
jgi:hypothetical protein